MASFLKRTGWLLAEGHDVDDGWEIRETWISKIYLRVLTERIICYAMLVRPPKIFQDSLSHRILQHMHEALNIDENKN